MSLFWILLKHGWRRWWWHLDMQNCSQIVTTNITPNIFTGWMPFLSPNLQRQSTEGRQNKLAKSSLVLSRFFWLIWMESCIAEQLVFTRLLNNRFWREVENLILATSAVQLWVEWKNLFSVAKDIVVLKMVQFFLTHMVLHVASCHLITEVSNSEELKKNYLIICIAARLKAAILSDGCERIFIAENTVSVNCLCRLHHSVHVQNVKILLSMIQDGILTSAVSIVSFYTAGTNTQHIFVAVYTTFYGW